VRSNLGTSTDNQNSIFDLFSKFSTETKKLIQTEIQLAKAEISEKFACFRKNGVFLVVGALVGYAGLIIFLVAIGEFIAYGFRAAGVPLNLSDGAGLGIMGLLVLGVGGGLIWKAVRSFSKESLVPQKTVETIQEFRGEPVQKRLEDKSKPKTESERIQAEVFRKEAEIKEAVQEIGYRLSPAYMKTRVKEQISTHPVGWSLAAVATGFVSALFLKRKFSKA
jgi:hypothetical protein